MPVGLPLPANLFRLAVQTTPIPPQGAPVGVAINTGGAIAANTYYAIVTALNAVGESIGSPESAAVTTTGTTSTIQWNWPAVVGATSYRIYLATATPGTEGNFFTSAVTSFLETAGPLGGTAGSPPVQSAMPFAQVSLMNTFDISGAESVAGFDVFESDDPIEFAGKQRRTLAVSGYLADNTDTGQAILFAAAAAKQVVTIRSLWDGTNGFIQQCRVNAYKGGARAGNQPLTASFDFLPTKAAGVIVGVGPLL